MPSICLKFILFTIAWHVAAVPASHYEHERRDLTDPLWIRRAPVDGNEKIVAKIGLTQSNLIRGEELLNEISDPDSPKYGKWYSATEVADLFEPSQDTISAVKQWLVAEGFSEEKVTLISTSQWIHLDTTVAELEYLLHTKYHYYEHAEHGKSSVACDRYHLPRTLQAHIDFITPGVKIGGPHKRESPFLHKRSLSSPVGVNKRTITRPMPIPVDKLMAMPPKKRCNIAVTPECIKMLYNITGTYNSAPGNQLGIYETSNIKFDQHDLDLFFTRFAPHINNGTSPTIKSIDGGVAETTVKSEIGTETLLDLNIAYPLVHSHEIVEFITDDGMLRPDNRHLYTGLGLNDFLDAVDSSYCNYTAYGATGKPVPGVDQPFPDKRKGGYKGTRQCGGYSPPNVISISYSWGEAYSPVNYQRRQCNEWMKLGMMGITTVLSSGDWGVAQGPMTFPGPQCLGKKGKIFNPSYPVNCPYILSVGSTYIPEEADFKVGNEVATHSFYSGGGFSNIYPTPSYQKTQVHSYLANANLNFTSYAGKYNSSFGANGGVFNRAGRGYPDVSAMGDFIPLYVAGKIEIAGGTSVSAPLWASLLTRINGERLAAGMPTVGFVNPILYRNPQVFHDVTKGVNTACYDKGFHAAKGWDPVTGLGTPNYPKLMELFMNPSSSA